MSNELYELKGDIDKLQDEFDDLECSYDDLEASYKSLNIAYEVLQDHNSTIKASVQDFDQKNKDLQTLNTSFLQKNSALIDAWSTLSASKYGLENEHTMLESLYKQTRRQNTDLKVNIEYVQEISAANAEQAVRSSDALRNAESKIAYLEEQVDLLKNFVDSSDELRQDTIADDQDLLTRLSALEEENARLVKAASVQERNVANKDIEISALRVELSFQESALARSETERTDLLNVSSAHECSISNKDEEIFALRQEVSLQEQAITRLAKNVVQEEVHQRLVKDAAERESYIKALDNVILYNAEKGEEAEKKLAWHRLAFEEERKHAEDLQNGPHKTCDTSIGAFVDYLEQRDPNWTFEDLPAPAADAQEHAQDLVATILLSEPEIDDAETSEEDLDELSNIAEDGFTDEEDFSDFSDTVDTLVLTDSKDSSAEYFESTAFSDGDSDVDMLLE